METRQIHVRDLSTVTGIQQYEHCVQSIFFLGLEDFEGTIYLSLESDKFSEDVALTNNTFIIGQPMTKFNVTYTCQIYGIVGTGEKIQLSKQFRMAVYKSNNISGEAGEYPIDPNLVNGIDQYVTEKESQIDDYVEQVIESIPSDYTELEGRVDTAEDVIGITYPIEHSYTVTGTSINTSTTRINYSGTEGDTIEVTLNGTSWTTGSKCFVYIRYDGNNDDTLLGAIDYPAVSATYTLAHDTVSIAIYARNLTAGTIGYAIQSTALSGLIGDIADINDRLDAMSGLPTPHDYDKLVDKVGYIYDGVEYFYGDFVRGTLHYGVLGDLQYRVATDTIMTYARDILLTIESGFRVLIVYYVDGAYSSESGWKQGTYTVPANTYFKVLIARILPEDTSEIADVDLFVSKVHFPTYTQAQINTLNQGSEITDESARIALYDKCFGNCRFVNHLGTPYYNGLVIPCQSRFDIERASRAGFVAIEFNAQKTSDNKYIVTHGTGGNFGAEFYSLDSTDLTSVAFSSKTLSWIKENVRCNSANAKYRVAPLTLEEALLCAKQNGMVPYVSYTANTPDTIAIADSILGKGNYILGIYSSDRPNGFSGVCASWLTITDVDELVAKCDASGGAYVAGINASNSAYSSFTLDDWKAMVDAVHAKGYRISTAYITDPNLQRTLEKAGFDYIFSTYQIPTISHGNICSLRDNSDFTAFTHQGTVTDGRLVLTDGQTVIPSESLTARVSSGGNLGVAFIGTIKINLGTYINQIYSFTSTDASEMWNFSTYFNGAVPTFTITAVGNVTISELYYDASEY